MPWYAILGIIFACVVIFSIVIASIKTDDNTTKKPTDNRQLSYKQQMYLNSLRGDKTSPYSQAAYIMGQSAFDAFSNFITDLFGYPKNTPENDKKLHQLLGLSNDDSTIKVVSDGHKDINFPRTSSSFFKKDNWVLKDFLSIGNGKMLFFFNNTKSELSILLKKYFHSRNIEIKKAPAIKPFSNSTNYIVEIELNSENTAFIYYLIRTNKARSALGLKHHQYPRQNYNEFHKYLINKYKFTSEYELMRYLITYFIADQQMVKLFFTHLSDQAIQDVRDVFNHNRGFNNDHLIRCQNIEKELNKTNH